MSRIMRGFSGIDDTFLRAYKRSQYLSYEWQNWSSNWSQFPGLPFAFRFEDNFRHSHPDQLLWLRDRWHYSLYISVVYIVAIHAIQRWMRSRSAFNLRHVLIVWNLLLALFSIIAAIRCLPEFIDILRTKGLVASYCNSSYYEDIRVVFWYWAFVISKVVELGDTLFITLRKQPLIKLHWIHHTLTLCYSWFVYSDLPSTSRWMVVMNLTIHSIMYTYYALKASRVVPVTRGVAKCITLLQIVQMFAGLYVNVKALQFKATGIPCEVSPRVMITGAALYSLYCLMFIKFFVTNYLRFSPPSAEKRPNNRYKYPLIKQIDINSNYIYRNGISFRKVNMF